MQLIVTEEERNSASYLDWSDEALGRAVRACAFVLADKQGQNAINATTCGCLLVKMCVDAGSDDSTIRLENVTIPQEVGNWIITIKKNELE
jgi:hypothetical protein